MRWQRNMFQMKEQDKAPGEELSEVEIGSLLKRVQSYNCKDDQRTQEKNGWTQWEFQQRDETIRHHIAEEYDNWTGKYTRGIQQWTNWTRRKNQQSGDRAAELTQKRAAKRKKMKSKDSSKDLQNNIKWPTFTLYDSQKDRQRVAENFPNPGKGKRYSI